MMSLDDQIVFVAGGAGAVGEGITRQFLRAGATVIAASRSASKLETLQRNVQPVSDRLVPLPGHLSDEDGARALRQAIVERFGRLDHVVASLGGWWQGKPVTEISLALWRKLLDSSLTAHFLAAHTFIPLVAQASGSYTLINGAGALNPVPTAGPISTSAAAQLMLGRVLAAENADTVRVNNLILATPVITRERPTGRPGWLSADDAGRYCVYIAQSNLAGETIVFDDPHMVPM